MAKTKKVTTENGKTSTNMSYANSPKQPTYTIPSLRANKDLWHNLLILHDLKNLPKNKASENRLLQTTDALYISTPYFTADEAEAIKGTIVDEHGTTLELAIGRRLQNFFEKRRASGDWRPCGPHDLVPVFLKCLGFSKEVVDDEKFVARLRRSGFR